MKPVLIFDLDLTLVDSSLAETARRNRDWQRAYSLIPEFSLYDGIPELFSMIRELSLKTAVVSTSPKSYVERVVRCFQMPVDVIIGYHDAPRKPSPDGSVKAMLALDAKADQTISFGDRVIDIQAAKAAGVKSVGCFWGSEEPIALKASNPDISLCSATEIPELIKRMCARI